MGSKKIDLRFIEHFGRELKKVVDEQYGGNQTAASKDLDISQPHISNLIAHKTSRGPGLSTLLRMREKTGRSIDALLGLPPLPQDELIERLRMSADLEIARIRAEAARAREDARRTVAEAKGEKDEPNRRRSPKRAG